MEHFKAVRFRNYKALKRFSINFNEFNVLVGPNNVGKSTIIGSFHLLVEGIRKARSKSPEYIDSVRGFGYQVPLNDIPIATENIFSDYDDSEPASVEFEFSSGRVLKLFFPENDSCFLVPVAEGRPIRTPSEFKRSFPATVGFVPILGPVEHNEPLYQREAARKALLTHRASRNFRNIWHHYPEGFDEFRQLIVETWPGMDIQRPEIGRVGDKAALYMFCPEKRFPREIYWAGFGFQVWCQMLTYILRASAESLLIIDEPDIYLHSDLQRQLVSVLREVAPDVLIATHSTEIIAEAEPNELLVMRKGSISAYRVKNVDQLGEIFSSLGSNLNPVLTQLAKTRRAIFVEGKDFRIISSFARKLGYNQIANRSDFAVIPAHGFNPVMVKNFRLGIESTVGKRIDVAIIFDRDFRVDDEVDGLLSEFAEFSEFSHIHHRKEIENYLLDPQVLQKLIDRRIKERMARSDKQGKINFVAQQHIEQICAAKKSRVMGQYLARGVQFKKIKYPSMDQSTLNQVVLEEFENRWSTLQGKLELCPGKEVFSDLNVQLREICGTNITPTSVLSIMNAGEVPLEIRDLIKGLDCFLNSQGKHH